MLRCTKLLNVLCTVLFFSTSGGGVDDVLVRLLLTEKIIKGANLMPTSFTVKRQ